MKRLVRAITVALLVGALAALDAVAPAVAATPVPRVVLVVGPAGSLTSEYRGLANAAAREAISAGADVTKVYSPNATWPAVRRALRGASIVVYLGHGNGWPSIYRSSLYPPTQNGFGLNPVAGVDDDSHQYFGEAAIEDLQLAPGAVVLLHHLCYASGNTEPGLPEGTEAMSIQRVDNYAAGFIRAGADAVVAEGHLGPAYYVHALLTTDRTIEQIWRGSPSRHGNTFAVPAVRSPGYTARLDPDRPSHGYYRSLVSRGQPSSSVQANRTGQRVEPSMVAPANPSLAGLRLDFGTPTLARLPLSGTTSALVLPLAPAQQRALPEGIQLGVRWDPVALDPELEPVGAAAAGPTVPDQPVPGTLDGSGPPDLSPAPSVVPEESEAPESAGSADGRAPAASTEPSPTLGLREQEPLPEPPPVELVLPEQPGTVVALAVARRGKAGLKIALRYPDGPGLYRLMLSLHAANDVAYDQRTQDLLTPLLVRVAGPVAAAYAAPAAISTAAGDPTRLQIRVANTGSADWDGSIDVESRSPIDGRVTGPRRLPSRLVASWVSAAGMPVPGATIIDLGVTVGRSGGEEVVPLTMTSPTEPGSYLVLIDVSSPMHGPLSALGSDPAIVRVFVTPAASAPPTNPPAPWPAPAEPSRAQFRSH